MATFNLIIVSAERKIFEGAVKQAWKVNLVFYQTTPL